MAAPAKELLKISELAERADVPVATVRHYLREGLLPEPVKTSRNMAWYPPEFVERIQLIKELQERRFMPLKAIKGLLELARVRRQRRPHRRGDQSLQGGRIRRADRLHGLRHAALQARDGGAREGGG